MTLYTKKKVFGVLYIFIAYLLAILIVGNSMAFQFSSIISQYLGQETTKIVYGDGSEDYDADYFKLGYSSYRELRADEEAYAKNIQAEGVVLLQNVSLPLDTSAGLLNVTLLGIAGRDDRLAGGGNSSGTAVSAQAPTMLECFLRGGMNVNQTMQSYYQTLGEETAPADFTQEAKSSVAGYDDLAVVFIQRGANESTDLAVEALSLTEKEKALVDYAVDSFDNAVVLLNTANPIQCDYFEGKAVNVLWIGTAGDTGLGVVPQILTGQYSPSGHLVDTYAYDMTSAPAFMNIGDHTLTNVDENTVGNKWINYAENIYIGYRYYETRYADIVMGTGNAEGMDYASTVQYPFGYGLSYTTFELSQFSLEEQGDNFTLSVQVTNTGDVAGKEAVGFYMQSPYTDYDRANGVEKSAIQLVAFGKTSELAPGASETVTATVSKELLRAYDAQGAKTYIVDAGDYYFTAAQDVHQGMNNILAAQGYTTSDGMTAEGDAAMVSTYTQASLDAETYSYGANGEKITNQFDNSDLRYYDDSVVYLSRSDWAGTMPTMAGDREATPEMIDDLHPHIEEASVDKPVTGADNGLKLLDLKGADYNDEKWDLLLNEMSAREMMDLVAVGGYQTLNVDSISKPLSIDQDGTASINGSMMGGYSMFVYPGAYLTSCTWNSELASQLGYFIAQDGLMTGITGWYAPGANMHRTGIGGKTSEYYSEDPVFSSTMLAGIISKAQEGGMVSYVKHFFLNDQETNRTTACTFATEQAIREIYLMPFEKSMTDGGATGVMTAMNRVGMRYASAHSELLNNVIRGEWGFEGIVITDAALSQNEKIRPREVLLSGTDLFLCTNRGVFEIENFENDAVVLQALRQASHRILFAMVNSNVMNGITPDTQIITVTPEWQKALITADVIAGVILTAAVVAMTVSLVKSIRKSKKA